MLLTAGVTIFSIRYSKVQTFIVKKVTNYVNKNYQIDIQLSSIYLKYPYHIEISDLLVLDHQLDTLAFIGKIEIGINDFNIDNKSLLINDLDIHNSSINLIKYRNDPLYNYEILVQKFTSNSSSSEARLELDIFDLDFVDVKLKYFDYNKKWKKDVMDFNHLIVNIHEFKAEQIGFHSDHMVALIDDIKLQELSGFNLSEFTTVAFFNKRRIDLHDLIFKTSLSKFNGDLSLLHNDWKNYHDFLEKVPFKMIILDSSLINTKDIGYFVESLNDVDLSFDVFGSINGSVSDLKTDNLVIKYGHDTELDAAFSLKGLPDLTNSYLKFDFDELALDVDDIKHFAVKLGYDIDVHDKLVHINQMTYSGHAVGFLNDISFDGLFNSSVGQLKTDFHIAYDQKGNGTFEGELASTGIALDKLLKPEYELQALAFAGKFKGSFSKNKLEAEVVTKIPVLEYKNYDYQNMSFRGNVNNQKIDGFFSIYDENISLVLSGFANLETNNESVRVNATLSHADLHALKIYTKDSINTLSGSVLFNLNGSNINKLNGFALFSQINYITPGDTIYLKSFQVNATQKDSISNYTVVSDNINLNLDGVIDFTTIANQIRYQAYLSDPLLFEQKAENPNTKQQFNFNLHVYRPAFLSKLLIPDLQFTDSLSILGSMKSSELNARASINSKGLNYKGFVIKRPFIEVNFHEDIFESTFSTTEFVFSDSLGFEDVLGKVKSVGNHFQTDVSWNTTKGIQHNGNISSLISIFNHEEFIINFLQSDIKIENDLWTLNESNEISIIGSNIRFSEFDISNNEQKFKLDGWIADNPASTLSIQFENFNISGIDHFIQSGNVNLGGFIHGTASLSNVYDKPLFSSNLTLDKLSLNNQLFGSGKLLASWKHLEQKISVLGQISSPAGQYTSVSGFYFPYQQENALDVKLKFIDLKVDFIEPFIDDYVSNLSGMAKGEVLLMGNLAKPIVKGELNLKNTKITIDYLNSTYAIEDEKLLIDEDWMGFNYITISDEKGNEAKAVGTIFHENYENFNFDISLFANNFQMLNTNSTHNALYYGSAFASGDINIGGFSNSLLIDVDVVSEKNTVLSIPLTGAKEISSSDFITFVSKEIKEEVKETVSDLAGIQMNFQFEVNQNTELQIIFDDNVGDVMKAKGNGNIQMKINTKGDFNMYGDYIVNEGDYLFTLKNVINKRFRIRPGGTIVWSGDPLDAKLDLTAYYRLRSSLVDLNLPIDSTAARKRVPVEVNLKMRNNILNPEIDFDIYLPSLEENTSAMIDASIVNEEEMNRQVFSLLMLNKFAAPQSGLQASGAVGASYSELLANQLTNLLSKSKVSEYVEIGVNEIKSDELEVAVSKSFFNDRVVVSGNIGSSSNQNEVQSQSSSVVGDFNIEYVIKKDGKLKANAFRKSNDYNLFNSNFAPYTEGVGLFYREDFNTWLGLMKKVFSKRPNKTSTALD